MKLHLTRATNIDPVANTSSESNILHIFVNKASDYPAVVDILQKGIDAIKALLKTTPNTTTHRIDVVLSVTPSTGRKIEPATVMMTKKIEQTQAELTKTQAELITPEKKEKSKKPIDLDAEMQIDAEHQEAAQRAATAAIEAELARKSKELDLLREKIGKKDKSKKE